MLKAKILNMLIIGITEENLKRLQAGVPMVIDLRDCGIEGDMMLLSGRDEEAVADEIRLLVEQGRMIENGEV